MPVPLVHEGPRPPQAAVVGEAGEVGGEEQVLGLAPAAASGGGGGGGDGGVVPGRQLTAGSALVVQ